ncbi:MAG: metallophosphoesterase family protein [Methanobacteriaceae archaeon]
MTVIAHISDLHIGGEYFNEKIFNEGIKQINDLNPDMVLITGDIVDNGYYTEFLRAKELLNTIQPPFFAVPGNHDARNVGYEIFEEIIGECSWKLTKDDDNLFILGLDSSEPDIASGHIGRPQQSWAEHELSISDSNSNFSIVAMHHHIISVPKTGRERNILTDAGDILKTLLDFNVDLVICGHKHVPNLWKMESTLFVNAGSFSSSKLRAKYINSYNTYHIEDDYINIVLNEVKGNKLSLGRFNKI